MTDWTENVLTFCGTVTPRYYNVPVPALLEKVKIEMAGPEAVFNYVDTLMQTAALSMSAKLAIDIFRDGQASSTGHAHDRSKFINGQILRVDGGLTLFPG